MTSEYIFNTHTSPHHVLYSEKCKMYCCVKRIAARGEKRGGEKQHHIGNMVK